MAGFAARPVALRIGIAARGAFGELNGKQRESVRRLKEAFFLGRSDADLMPSVTSLPEP